MNRPLYIFMGPPGSGKGTQARILAKSINGTVMATGDIVRELIEQGDSPEIKERYDQGQPQEDALIIRQVARRMQNLSPSKPIVLDTFPLSIKQAKALEELQKKFSLRNPLVFYLDVTPQSVIRRIKVRKICKKCQRGYYPSQPGYKEGICTNCGGELFVRSDDQPEIIHRRIAEYQERMKELLKFYDERGQLIKINGEPAIDAVSEQISQYIP